MAYEDVARLVDASEHIGVVAHIRPDGDAVGSATALTAVLNRMGKQAVFYAEDVPTHLLSIPGAREYRREVAPDLDLVVAVDCASLGRVGPYASLFEGAPSINIDHHLSNTRYADVNVIEPVESTTVVLYNLFTELGIPLDTSIAHSLYAGLMTDTGSFRWGTPRMHDLAAEFLRLGVDSRQAAVDLVYGVSAEEIRLMGAALQTSTIHDDLLVLAVERCYEMDPRTVERLINLTHAVESVKLAAVFKEIIPNEWTVSLRSTEINVAEVAGKFGGGGHRYAAGYSAYGTKESVEKELRDAL